MAEIQALFEKAQHELEILGANLGLVPGARHHRKYGALVPGWLFVSCECSRIADELRWIGWCNRDEPRAAQAALREYADALADQRPDAIPDYADGIATRY